MDEIFSDLMVSVIRRNESKDLPFLSDFSELSESDKIKLYQMQKNIIIQFRQESGYQLQYSKDKLRELMEKHKELRIFEDDFDANSDSKSEENKVKINNSKSSDAVFEKNIEIIDMKSENKAKRQTTLKKVQNDHFLIDSVRRSGIRHSKLQDVRAKARVQARSVMYTSNYKGNLLPQVNNNGYFKVIDNKLKQINMEIRALTIKQRMIAKKFMHV